MNVELGLILPKINVKGQVQSGSDYILVPTYSSVLNRRAVRNKRAGGKILKKH